MAAVAKAHGPADACANADSDGIPVTVAHVATFAGANACANTFAYASANDGARVVEATDTRAHKQELPTGTVGQLDSMQPALRSWNQIP
jgi:hypothetical protein